MSDFIIQTNSLTKRFGELTAVSNLDLEIKAGEIFGLLGPNGAGKTTTIGMLTTRVIPTEGTIHVGGVDVVKHPTAAKQIIGVVSQQNTLDRSLNVSENLFFHGRYFGMKSSMARKVTQDLLEQFRLTEKANESVESLSGGMAQRLMVARAIMHRPQILFLDEPTAGLDPQSRLALWEVLRALHLDGQTIVLTTHYMEEAEQLSDRLAIVDHGKLLRLGTPQELKQSIGSATELRLTPMDSDATRIADVAKSTEGVAAARMHEGAVFLELQTSSGALLPRLFHNFDEQGLQIRDVSVIEPSLESVFIRLTGKDLRE